jgi:hypothetical protein
MPISIKTDGNPIGGEDTDWNQSVYMQIHTNKLRENGLGLIEEDIKDDIRDSEEHSETEESNIGGSVAARVETEKEVYNEDYEIPETMWDWERIPDWGKRIAGYNDEQKKFYANTVPKFNEMMGVLASQNDWTILVDSSSD